MVLPLPTPPKSSRRRGEVHQPGGVRRVLQPTGGRLSAAQAVPPAACRRGPPRAARAQAHSRRRRSAASRPRSCPAWPTSRGSTSGSACPTACGRSCRPTRILASPSSSSSRASPKVHPMAFEFPRAEGRADLLSHRAHPRRRGPRRGGLRPRALSPAGGAESPVPRSWEESPQPAGMFMDVKKSQGLLAGDLHVYRQRLNGKLKNADTLV